MSEKPASLPEGTKRTGDLNQSAMTYPGGGNNAGDVEQSNTDPAMPGPRVMSLVKSNAEGASLSDGFGERFDIHGITPEEIGADTGGGGQVHLQHPKTPAGRGTRFG